MSKSSSGDSPENTVYAVVERFGSTGAFRRIDSEYFEVTAYVENNPQFYNWLLTFGTGAKILKPEWAAEAFLKHIDGIKNAYTTKPYCYQISLVIPYRDIAIGNGAQVC